MTQPLCTATTSTGKPCRKRAVVGATLCAAHLGLARGPDPTLSRELIETLVSMLRVGNLPAVAARAAGISRATLYRWLDDARKPRASELHVELSERVAKARAEGQVRLVAEIANAASTDWRAAAWLLARGYPEEWAQDAARIEIAPTPATSEAARDDPFAEIDELARKRAARAAP